MGLVGREGDEVFGSLVADREAMELEKKDLEDFCCLGDGWRGIAEMGDLGWLSYPSAKL